MALHILAAIENFRIPHRPDEHCQLRIGIHTGNKMFDNINPFLMTNFMKLNRLQLSVLDLEL